MGVIWVFVIFMGLWANALDAYIFPDWFGGLAFGGTSVKQETESPSAGAKPREHWNRGQEPNNLKPNICYRHGSVVFLKPCEMCGMMGRMNQALAKVLREA